MAPTSFIKLANKLPRIALPTAMPNGQTPLWTLDPYLESPVNLAPWEIGNSAFVNAVYAKANGMTIPSGQAYQGLFRQTVATQSGAPKIYVEIDAIKGAIWLYDGSTIITQPGAYIIEQPLATISQLWFYAAESLFTPYPSFENLPEGALPVTGSSTPDWKEYAISGSRKLSNGRVAIDMNAGGVNSVGITYNSEWALTTPCVAEITVDYIPPGGEIRYYHGDRNVGIITAPGQYRFDITWMAPGGVRPALTNNTRVMGEAIISRFFVRSATQQWWIQGSQFFKPSALFMAEKSLFDRIIDPKYQVSSNQYSRDNLASAIQPNTPQLGYSGYLPPAGMHRVGDTIYNPSGSPSGWRCMQAGNPGVWAPLPTL